MRVPQVDGLSLGWHPTRRRARISVGDRLADTPTRCSLARMDLLG